MTTTTSLSWSWTTICNKWQITNLGTAATQEHKYSSFCWSSKGVTKSDAPHINKNSSPLSVLMLFFTEIFHLLVEQTNIYYQQHLDQQAGPSRWLPDITLPDMMTFVALALQMGHDLKDTLHDCWSRLKRGDIRVRTRGGLTALVWKDRWEVYMLTNMNPPTAEGNCCDDSKHTVNPHIVEQYNWHMGYINNSERMANRYPMSRCAFKWTTKLFFHLLDLTVLNSWIPLSSCRAKYTHRDFRLLLVRNLIEKAG